MSPNEVIDLMTERVDENMNSALTKQVTPEEVSDAFFQIGPLKAPGPDGFPARFFQRNWGVMKEEVTNAVIKFFEDGIMPEGINETVIVLIPKGNNPQSIKDYRPISLCNVINKVI